MESWDCGGVQFGVEMICKQMKICTV
uniref:Uncharacterized protein n=1 Tax=Arundo donax TaxID=35708 RepID=A0A0A9HD37_ARUDO